MPRPEDGSLSKVNRPHQKQPAHTFLYKVPKSVKTDILLCFTKMAISPLIMVRFEKFKIWHTQENKPVLQDGLDPIFVRPDVFLSASGGRTGIIWNTDSGVLTSVMKTYFSCSHTAIQGLPFMSFYIESFCV